MAHKGRGIIDRNGATANHADLWIFEGGAQVIKGQFFWNNIGADQYNDRTGSLFQEEINGRSFAFALLLHTETHARILPRYFVHNRHRAVGATAGNDNHFLKAKRWALLVEYSAQSAANICLFVICHDTYTASNTTIFFRFTYQSCLYYFVLYPRCH